MTASSRKYMAFDLEIAREIPEGGDWQANSPLGISCAGIRAGDTGYEAPQIGLTVPTTPDMAHYHPIGMRMYARRIL